MQPEILLSQRVTQRVQPVRLELEFLAQVHTLSLVIEERVAAAVVLSPLVMKPLPSALLERLGALASYSGVTINVNPPR
jgi:hypothetical protein